MDSAPAIPKLDLTTFFLSISAAAYLGLGAAPPGAEGGECKLDLELARQNIELLELMRDKTRGNRTPDEDRLLEQLLFELRMRFVDVQKSAGGGR
jgi:hypothetical protein